MSKQYGAQPLPDDGGSKLVWYCHSFGVGLEFDTQRQRVIQLDGESSKLPDNMGVHLNHNFEWELVGAVPRESVAAIDTLIGVQSSGLIPAQLASGRQNEPLPAARSAPAGPSTARTSIPTINPGSEIGNRTALSHADAILLRAQGDQSCTACLMGPKGPIRCIVSPPVWNMWSKEMEQQLTTGGNTICIRCLSTARWTDERNISNDCNSVYKEKDT